MSGRSSDAQRVVVDVWSDIACPVCHIEEVILKRAIEEFEHSDAVILRHRSFQIMPDLPVGVGRPLRDVFGERSGSTPEQVAEVFAQFSQQAASADVPIDLDRVVAANTRAAHRLLHAARAEGKDAQLLERLFRAYFVDGDDVGSASFLLAVAAEVGVDQVRASAAIAGEQYDDDVAADIARAHELGLKGVPYILLNGQYALVGGQTQRSLVNALRTAWDSAGIEAQSTSEAADAR